MLIVKVKNSQSEMVNTGYLFQSTYHVDDSLTDGIKAASFVGIKGDGAVAGLYGTDVKATLQYADALHAPRGVVYKESRMSQYSGQMEQLLKAEAGEPEVLKPYGNIEDTAIGLLRKGVFEITDTDKTTYRYFRTVETALKSAWTATIVTAGADVVIPLTTDFTALVEVGHPVQLIAGGVAIEAEVKSIGADTITVIAKADTAAVEYDVVAPSLLGYPVYLNLAQATDGELPFTLKSTSGKKVGWIESTMAVRFDVNLAL